MAGRVRRLRLYGLSQGEAHGRHDDFAARIAQADSARLVANRAEITRADYAELITRGSYPEARAMPAAVHRRWLDSYLTGIVRRDLGDLRREVSPTRAEALLRALAGNQSGEVVKARLATATAIPAANGHRLSRPAG
jgi:predicted AAA+ superfamily ATPase